MLGDCWKLLALFKQPFQQALNLFRFSIQVYVYICELWFQWNLIFRVSLVLFSSAWLTSYWWTSCCFLLELFSKMDFASRARLPGASTEEKVSPA